MCRTSFSIICAPDPPPTTLSWGEDGGAGLVSHGGGGAPRGGAWRRVAAGDAHPSVGSVRPRHMASWGDGDWDHERGNGDGGGASRGVGTRGSAAAAALEAGALMAPFNTLLYTPRGGTAYDLERHCTGPSGIRLRLRLATVLQPANWCVEPPAFQSCLNPVPGQSERGVRGTDTAGATQRSHLPRPFLCLQEARTALAAAPRMQVVQAWQCHPHPPSAIDGASASRRPLAGGPVVSALIAVTRYHGAGRVLADHALRRRCMLSVHLFPAPWRPPPPPPPPPLLSALQALVAAAARRPAGQLRRLLAAAAPGPAAPDRAIIRLPRHTETVSPRRTVQITTVRRWKSCWRRRCPLIWSLRPWVATLG